jgi:hypothetical protein
MLAALARILEAHTRALDPAEADARKELDAYAALVTAHRDVADRLSGIGVQMAEYRSLPMAAHDEAAMSDAWLIEPLRTLSESNANSPPCCSSNCGRTRRCCGRRRRNCYAAD